MHDYGVGCLMLLRDICTSTSLILMFNIGPGMESLAF